MQIAVAEEPAPVSGSVVEVTVRGNRWIEEDAVLSRMVLQPGSTLSRELLRADLKSIYATGFFEDVRLELEEGPNGPVLVVRVVEKPAVVDVRVEGNKKVNVEDINEVIDVDAYGVLNQARIKETVQKIRDLYVEKGFYLVEIDVEQRAVGDNQVEVVFNIVENRKVRVHQLEFIGNDHLPDSKVKRFLQTKEAGFAPWLTSSGNFSREAVDTDQQIIGAVYMEEGYLDAQVDPAKVYLSPDKRHIYVSFQIEEGDQYSLGQLDTAGDFIAEEGLTKDHVMQIVDGRPVVDIQEELWRESKGRKGLKKGGRSARMRTGDTFRYSTLQAILGNIQSFYRDQGYAFVNVIPMTKQNPAELTVDITFRVETGQKVNFGEVRITGNDPTFDKVVRRELQIDEGTIYRGSRLDASRMRLERTGFFESVRITTPRGDQPDTLDVEVDVTEQPTGSFSVGLGFSNLEKLALNASVSKNNFFGLGYQVSASINWSRLRKQGQISFFDPYFLDSRWTMRLDGYYIQREYQLNEYQRGGTFGLGRYLDRQDTIQLRLDYTIEDVGLTSIDPYRARLLGGDLFRNGLASSIGVSLFVDRRNNRIMPTKGILISAKAALTGGFRINDQQVLSLLGGDFNFVELNFNFRWYQPLIPNSDWLIFRVNSTVGAVFSTDGRTIPYIHRYRAGGINSVRGFQWFSLGPAIPAFPSDDFATAPDKLVIGGTQSWINNIEIESPIVKAAGVSAVVFFDAGNAFGDPWGGGAINPLKLRTSMGFGVRWRSPIGPLRFEWGFPLKPLPDERRSVFEFTIGNFF